MTRNTSFGHLVSNLSFLCVFLDANECFFTSNWFLITRYTTVKPTTFFTSFGDTMRWQEGNEGFVGWGQVEKRPKTHHLICFGLLEVDGDENGPKQCWTHCLGQYGQFFFPFLFYQYWLLYQGMEWRKVVDDDENRPKQCWMCHLGHYRYSPFSLSYFFYLFLLLTNLLLQI